MTLHRFALLWPIALGLVLIGAATLYWPEISAWVKTQQRLLQTDLARAVQAVRSGDGAATWALIGACLLYGLVHAVGPGHGKFLIGGAAIASRRTAWRMAGIALAASLAQGVTAILLVYGGLGVLSYSSAWAIGATETVLTPLSYAAIAAIGGWIAWRGVRTLRGSRGLARSVGAAAAHELHVHAHTHARANVHAHTHDQAIHRDHEHGLGCAAGCRHAPTVAEVERVEGWRDVMALILSIGARPCSGALIVLAIAWRFELFAIGIAGTMAMALGTGAVVAGVALAASAMRDAGRLREAKPDNMTVFGWVQVSAGLAVALVAALLALDALTSGPAPVGLIR